MIASIISWQSGWHHQPMRPKPRTVDALQEGSGRPEMRGRRPQFPGRRRGGSPRQECVAIVQWSRTPPFHGDDPGSNPGSNPRVRAVDVRGRRVPSLAGETPTQREDRSTAVRPKHLGQGELKSYPWDASERGLSSSTTGSTCAACPVTTRKPGPAMAK